MILYATVTATRRNRAALVEHGWRFLLTPDTNRRGMLPPDGSAYALDNGAWGCFQRGVPFDEAAFIQLVDAHGAGADWIVAPDVVGAGLESLRLSVSWLPRLLGVAPLVLVAVQDGMTEADVAPLLGPRVGLFLGGSTEWKLATMWTWGSLARRAGCHYHVARVNSARRIRMAATSGAHSIDGTSATRFAKNAEPLALAAEEASKNLSLLEAIDV